MHHATADDLKRKGNCNAKERERDREREKRGIDESDVIVMLACSLFEARFFVFQKAYLVFDGLGH